eukprot:g37532.t1
MVGDWKVLSFVMNRAQTLYKALSKSTLGLTGVEEATSGAAEAVGQVDRCVGERLSNVERLFCALNGDTIKHDKRLSLLQSSTSGGYGLYLNSHGMNCDRSILDEMLGSSSGIRDNNVMQYLGLIEQRTNELLSIQSYLASKGCVDGDGSGLDDLRVGVDLLGQRACFHTVGI